MLGPSLSGSDAGPSGRPQGQVSGLPAPPGVQPEGPPDDALSSPAPQNLTDGNRAVALAIRAAVETGQGVRLGAIGDTGTGKSELLRAAVEAYHRGTGGALVIVDDGGQGGFAGEPRIDLADVRENPIEGTRLVLAGDVFTGRRGEPEEGARIAWSLARRRKKVALVLDELNDAVKNCFWRRGVELVPRALTKGRKYGLSVFWTTQQVQDCPREAFNETDALAVFRLVGTGLDRLEERGYLRGIDRSVIEGLPGFDAPPDVIGAFVLLIRGAAWNGCIYRLTL